LNEGPNQAQLTALGDWHTRLFGLAIPTFDEPQQQIVIFEGGSCLVGIYRRSERDHRNQTTRRLGSRSLSSLVPGDAE